MSIIHPQVKVTRLKLDYGGNLHNRNTCKISLITAMIGASFQLISKEPNLSYLMELKRAFASSISIMMKF